MNWGGFVTGSRKGESSPLLLVSKSAGSLPGLASPGRAMKEQLLRRPERDLNLDGHAGWRREAQNLAGAVVTRDRRVPGVQVREVGRLRDPAEGIGLLAAREEGLRSRRARRDEPTLDLDRAVAGTGPAAADAVEAEAALGIAPGLRPVRRAVELNPAPIATGSLRAEDSVVAVERKADLPHVVAGPTAVGARRRGKPGRQRRRSGKHRQHQKRTSHKSPLSVLDSPRPADEHPEAVAIEGQAACGEVLIPQPSASFHAGARA